ncbi:hypothetical protein BT63DRAFT_415359 [Microthyrium microscopicum]|uniref:Sas10 C-terminal domain-containing protein n=1 Tax=Microthyrium microscopicum TaxID=703497 RepID=A0A6A6U6F6_9PEZI|nr:hypothetical protein BT63DRAFT_415359 [Microthyrium microscopicum]
MAKKRKGGPSKAAQPENPGYEDLSGARLKMSSWEDVMDSEDEFIANREKILLDEGPARKKVRKMREEEALLEASDDEILELPSSEDDEESDEEEFVEEENQDEFEEMDIDEEITGKKKVDHEEEELEGWGNSRRDLYGDDELETEADALAHEEEARRIQQKQLMEMNDADFGFEDDAWTNAEQVENNADISGEHITELLPTATIDDNDTPEERSKMLLDRYPEFEALKKEFLGLQKIFTVLEKAQAEDLAALNDHAIDMPIPSNVVKFQALASYLGVLAMYFSLLTSTANDKGKSLAKSPLALRDHDVMQALVQARSTWMAARDLEDISPESSPEPEVVSRLHSASKSTKAKSAKSKKPELSRTELAKLASEARRAARLAAVEADFADLDVVSSSSKPRKSKTKPAAFANDEDSDFGDETELLPHEAAAKAAKRKSLRFYTSQIAQKAKKRNEAGRAIGGDTDLPQREKWHDRQVRAQNEAEKRKQMLDEHRGAKKDEPAPQDDEDALYDNIMVKSKEAKAAKKAAATAAYEANSLGRTEIADDPMTTDGKRKISYQIEKNKGLAPHRKKEVRNPRVKKRMKFEQKKKKLSSVKAVYKGGPGKGGYQGELTGIKTGLVKGIKLS